MSDDSRDRPFQFSRRALLANAGAAAAAAAVASRVPITNRAAAQTIAVDGPAAPLEGAMPVVLRINGTEHRIQVDPRSTLLDCLREQVRLTGTKKGCDHGQCGACTVHVNGRRVNSCLTLAIMHEGDEITTIEGIGAPDALHPMQEAFVRCDGYQCGYCTSGQIMSAVALLAVTRVPTDAEIDQAMQGNICRCGTYPRIRAGIHQAAETLRASPTASPTASPAASPSARPAR